ncbi:MAG: LysM peptidoglycan-binding domain-containing protein [Bacteroidia bacterium]
MRTYSRITVLALALIMCFSFSQAQKNAIPYKQFYGDLVKYSRQVKDKGEGEYTWVIHFWASWHTGSKQQIATLEAVYESYLNKPVRIISVSTDKVNSSWKNALGQYNMPWAQTRTPRTKDYDFLKTAFRHNSLPAIFIVDKNAKVRRMQDTKALVAYLKSQVPGGKPVVVNKPASKPTTTTKPKPNTTPNTGSSESGSWTYHTVAAGETLYSLFRRYGVAVDEIKRLNGLKSNTISVGQKLKIKKK